MIAKMLKCMIITDEKRKNACISDLCTLGCVHIENIRRKSQRSEDFEKIKSTYSNALKVLLDLGVKKEAKEESGDVEKAVMVINSLDKEKKEIAERIRLNSLEAERIREYGSFDPEDFALLEKKGIKIRIYKAGKKETEELKKDETFSFILLKEGKLNTIASLSDLPENIHLSEFALPSLSLSSFDEEIERDKNRIALINEDIKKYLVLKKAIEREIRKLDDEIMYSDCLSTLKDEGEVAYISGYIPSKCKDEFASFLKERGYAYAIREVSEDDDVPTLVEYNRVTRIVKPVFDILGTVPGYREMDISSYFLVFFSLFFAMIVGDAGYGLVFLIAAVIMNAKSRKLSDINILLYVLSITTIIWGALTGTYFGSEKILSSSAFLQSLVIPQITNFPEVMGVDSTWAQNMVMKFCFILGTIQLSLACIINVVRKIKSKDLSFVADLGWLLDILVLYGLVLYLVIGAECNFKAVAISVATGYVLVLLFGSQAPGVPFVKGMLSGLAGFFTTFLNTVSAFSNIMSYIRLFAVGMASLAIAESFNNMAGGMMSGAGIPLALIVILLGHVLNLVMGVLSVIVHGVRLNLLEFSGQLGMEWSGHQYEPFSKKAE